MTIRSTMFAAATVALWGCGSEPMPGMLNGNWGGANMAVSATSRAVVMNLGCGAIVRLKHGLFLDGSGRFAVVDSLRGSIGGGMRDTLPEHPVVVALISGRLVDDVLTVNVDLNYNAAPTGDEIVVSGRRDQPEEGMVCRA